MFCNYYLRWGVLTLINVLILNRPLFSQTCDTLTNNTTNLGIYGGLATDLTFLNTGRLFATSAEPASLFISDDTTKTFYRAFPNDSMIYECGQRGWGGGGMCTRANAKGWVATYTQETGGYLSAIAVSFQNGDTGTWRTAVDPFLLNQMGYGEVVVTGMNMSDYYLYGLLNNYIVKINASGFDSADVINIYDRILGLDSFDYARCITIANSSSGYPFYVVIDSSGSSVNAPIGKLYKYDGTSFTQISIPSGLSGLSKVYTHTGQITGDTLFIVGRSTGYKPKIYRSFDGGTSWTNISTLPGSEISDVNYAPFWQTLFPKSNGLQLINDIGQISWDLGTSWLTSSSLPSSSAIPLHSFTLCVSPNDTNMVIGSSTPGVYVSSNGISGSYVKNENNGLEAIFVKNIARNSSESIFYLATQSGIAYTTKYKDTTVASEDKWKYPYGMFPIDSTDILNGVSGIAIDPQDSLHVIAGVTDGFLITKTGPDGFKHLVIPNYQKGGTETRDIAFVNTNIAIAITGAGLNYFVGNGDIWRTEDGGNSWKNVSPSNFGVGNTVAVQYLDTDTIIYVGSGLRDLEDGHVWKSTDLGLSWVIVNDGPHAFSDSSFTNLPIQDIVIQTDTIYISAGYNGEALVMSTDKGLTYKYLNISSNIIEGLKCIEIDLHNPDSIVYLSAGKSLYEYNPALDTTTLLYTGLPGDIIYDLAIGSILVGTTTGFYGIDGDKNSGTIVSIPKNLNNNSADITLSPNPTSGKLNILVNTTSVNSSIELSLINIEGQTIQTIYKGKSSNTEMHLEYNTSVLSSGIYYLKLLSSDKIICKKVLVIDGK